MPKINLDAAAEKVGQDTSLDLTDKGLLDRTDQKIEIIDGPGLGDQVDMAKFMEEKVEIVIAESTDRNSENPVQLGVNGVPQFIFRGEQVWVRRKFVEVLARAKETSVQTAVVRPEGGEPINRVLKRSALKYPFSVVSDPNPKGPSWLKQILAEAA